MTYTPEYWNRIRRYYKDIEADIMAEKVNEWAFDAYAFEAAEIRFTPIETWFWHDIRECDAVLYPQYPVLNFFVDFANPKAKVAIECDGAAFHQDKAKDAARDARLREIGWTVYRITGSACRMDSDRETGQPSVALLFMRRICEMHGISRGMTWVPRGTGKDDDYSGPEFGFVSSEESITRWWERARQIREERRRDR